MRRFSSLLSLSMLILFSACKTSKDLIELSSKTKNGFYQAVVEIPAGTNKKIEYNKKQKKFIIDQREGKDRIIDFLPYPGNYGFIPATYSNPKEGGDGDAVDVLVLGESIETGSLIEITPIAILKLVDEKELDYKIIAIPAEANKQIIKTKNYQTLITQYPEVIEILELWFSYYDKSQSIEIKGWGDEQEATSEIEKWRFQP